MTQSAQRALRDQKAEALQGRRAGFVSRVAAAVIDAGVLGVVGAILLAVVHLVGSQWKGPTLFSGNLPDWLLIPATILAQLIYLSYFWGTTGRTVGDQLLGLRVVNRAADPLSPKRALLRAALYVLFPPGLLWVGLSRVRLSLQDIVVRTKVVYDWTYRNV